MVRRTCSAILLLGVALAGGCADQPIPTAVEPDFARPGPNAKKAELQMDVTFYWGPGHGADECANAAVEDVPGEYRFPQGWGDGFGNGACLIATVLPSGNGPTGGFVLWQFCGGPGNTQPKANCENGQASWVPRTGETWTAVDGNGQYMTASHGSSQECNGFLNRVGYRFLYSPVDPLANGPGAKFAVASDAFDVISDGTVLVDFSPCPS